LIHNPAMARRPIPIKFRSRTASVLPESCRTEQLPWVRHAPAVIERINPHRIEGGNRLSIVDLHQRKIVSAETIIRVASNTSPISNLAIIGRLNLLRSLVAHDSAFVHRVIKLVASHTSPISNLVRSQFLRVATAFTYREAGFLSRVWIAEPLRAD